MSAYLNLNANAKTKPNENYARELMELFCLGPTGPGRTPNYTQADIEGLTRALTGWRLNATELLPTVSRPTRTTGRSRSRPASSTCRQDVPRRHDPGGHGSDQPGDATNPAWGPAAVNQAIDIVLGHPATPQFLIRKLWAEFIASPIPQATLDYADQRVQVEPTTSSGP